MGSCTKLSLTGRLRCLAGFKVYSLRCLGTFRRVHNDGPVNNHLYARQPERTTQVCHLLAFSPSGRLWACQTCARFFQHLTNKVGHTSQNCDRHKHKKHRKVSFSIRLSYLYTMLDFTVHMVVWFAPELWASTTNANRTRARHDGVCDIGMDTLALAMDFNATCAGHERCIQDVRL